MLYENKCCVKILYENTGHLISPRRIYHFCVLSEMLIQQESRESTCELEGDVLVEDILNTKLAKQSEQENILLVGTVLIAVLQIYSKINIQACF